MPNQNNILVSQLNLEFRMPRVPTLTSPSSREHAQSKGNNSQKNDD